MPRAQRARAPGRRTRASLRHQRRIGRPRRAGSDHQHVRPRRRSAGVGQGAHALLREHHQRSARHVLADNSSPYEVTNAFSALMDEYARAVAPAVKYLGGAYINRDHVGRPERACPFAASRRQSSVKRSTSSSTGCSRGTRWRCRRRSCSRWAPTAGCTWAARRRSTAGSTSRTTSRR